MRTVREDEASEGPPLQSMQYVRAKDGPPLPMGEQLHWLEQPEILHSAQFDSVNAVFLPPCVLALHAFLP